MKILVTFYSRTGTTKKVGEMIAEKLNAQVEEIKDTVNRKGIKGYLISGRDAIKKKLTKLEPVTQNPANFDLVVVGTPVWGGNMSVPVRTYLTENKDRFKNVAFFCTMGGSKEGKVFSEMEEVIEKGSRTTLALRTREVVKEEFLEKVEKFVVEINN